METTKKINFSEARLPLLRHTFNLTQDFSFQLEEFKIWLEKAQEENLSEAETNDLKRLQAPLLRAGRGWNEVELESKFIAPLFWLANIEDGNLGYFMERELSAEVEGILLSGNVDAMIAKGLEEPEAPYFCMQEFKRSQDPRGSADAQALAAMLAAQALNKNRRPVYGLFVIGMSWNFMLLQGKEFVVSTTYAADGKGLFDIFKMLKALKKLILRP